MHKLRLGAYRLPAAEAGLLRALIVLLSNESSSKLRWEFVDSAPFDALVADGVPGDLSAQTLTNAVAYLTATADSAQGMTLVRPLRAEMLKHWLLNIQEGFPPGESPIHRELAPSSLALPQTIPTKRFKLKKWPPAQILREDPSRIRLATLLGRRALTVPELASMGGQSEEKCQSFLQALQSLTLLDISVPEAVEIPVTAQAAASRRHSAEVPRSRRGLVHSIRARLGLL